MTDVQRLEAYHYYEEEWEDYDELYDAFEFEIPNRFNMADYVCDRWASDKGRVALFSEDPHHGERTYTYRQLSHATNRLANHLQACGVDRGDRVAVNTPALPETVMGHLACWKLGAVSVPLSTLFGPDALSYRMDDASVVAGVVHASNVEAFREAAAEVDGLETVLTTGVDTPGTDAPGVSETDLRDAIADRDRAFDNATTDPDDDALLPYTSGTTGPPKGVRHGHRMLLGYLAGIGTGFDMEINESDLTWAPPEWAWVGSLFGIVVPTMFYGLPQVAYEGGGPFDPVATFEQIERYGVSNVFLPPTALRMMMQVDDPDERYELDSVRVILSGGESVGQSIVEWADDVFGGAVVHEAYGQTEHNPLVGDLTALGVEHRPGKMGKPMPGHEVTIVDPDTAEPLDEPGEVGEIAVRYEGDPSRFKGYWNQPEKTEWKVQNGWLLTEDLGAMDEDGYISFEGRTDDVIISSGYRIGPEEVEESVASHPGIAEAGVVGVPDDTRGTVPKAFAIPAPGTDPEEDLKADIKEHVRDRLADYEYPREIEFVDDLPMTPTGKIQRFELREREGLE